MGKHSTRREGVVTTKMQQEFSALGKIAASDKDDENMGELNEVEFLRFLTTQGRTMTRDQMRKTFASVDFDKSGGVSFIEWLCFRYEKTVEDLMTPQDPLPADLRGSWTLPWLSTRR